MSDTEKKSSSGVITKILALFATGLIVFFASEIWRAYERTNDAMSALERRLGKLEEDQSKWGTLTEMHNRMILLDREMYKFQGIFQYAMERDRPLPMATAPPKQPPSIGPQAVPEKPPSPPKLLPPDELFKNPDDFRKFQQHKYPQESDLKKGK